MAHATDPHDVIILYETKHKEMVKRIKTKLEENGIKVWFDENNAGIEIFVSMSHAIQDAKVVLVCISRFWQSSRSSEMEFNFAYSHGKEIILLRMDCHEPQGTLKALTAGKVNFKFYEDIGEKDFFLSITKLTNTIQAILSEGPAMTQFQETRNSPAMTQFQETRNSPVVTQFQETRNSPAVTQYQQTRNDMCADNFRGYGNNYSGYSNETSSINTGVLRPAVNTNDLMNTVLRNPNTLLHIMDETMDKPLKELPGLTTLSQLMDPVNVVDRVTELGNLYKLSFSDLHCISGSVGGNPQLTFLNFFQSRNYNMLISELRECLYTKKEEFGHAFLVINRYTNNQRIGEITPPDIHDLAVGLTVLPGEPYAGWEYVADYFGYGGQISELKHSNLNTTSRFESLCGIITCKFPDHTVRQFLENCRQLHFNDVVTLVENNIKQHAERTLKTRERRMAPDMYLR